MSQSTSASQFLLEDLKSQTRRRETEQHCRRALQAVEKLELLATAMVLNQIELDIILERKPRVSTLKSILSFSF
jgi:hypothetical protein